MFNLVILKFQVSLTFMLIRSCKMCHLFLNTRGFGFLCSLAAPEDFTKGSTQTLVATDVAARGLDVEDITLVVCCLATAAGCFGRSPPRET